MDAQNTTNTKPHQKKKTKTNKNKNTHTYTKTNKQKSLHTYPLILMYTLENVHMDTYTPPRTGGEEAEWRG